ncbi:hypothetical protein B0H34DRAFT_721926 [Crassisporium funariophilum]|nr:hypothetical protein B0H34DRAFT_721926 [Crassisporium funariophilum]
MASHCEVQPTTSRQKTLPRKPSCAALPTLAPQGARAKSVKTTVVRAQTVAHFPTCKPTRTSPGRGLTVEIQDSFASQSIQSAPARHIRALPTIPPPLPSSGSVLPIPTTPYTAPANLSCAPQTPRILRRLPCPPLMSPSTPKTPPKRTTPKASPATERPRIVRPLPVVLPQVASMHLNGDVTSQPVSSVKLQESAACITPRSAGKENRVFDDHVNDRDAKNSIEVEDDDPFFEDKRLHILLRLNSRQSLDSDCTNESDDGSVLHSFQDQEETEEDEADYAWVLANRTLYRQDPREVRYSNKWMSEKKGRRITERDYEQVLQALRTL